MKAYFRAVLSFPAKMSCSHRLAHPLPSQTSTTKVVKDFLDTVNMSPFDIEVFLQSHESWDAQADAHTEEERDSRKWARRCIEVLSKLAEQGHKDPHEYDLSLLYEGDLEHMNQITEYVRCQQGELKKVAGDKAAEEKERFKLMFFGYDSSKCTKSPVLIPNVEKPMI